mmetsp:Transcript_26912/g.62007  ORF Transcript_26912/g.62007 Transcript_26912/m.62007 type:complete len:202 (+) Transcript_26912:850-1455(+)
MVGAGATVAVECLASTAAAGTAAPCQKGTGNRSAGQLATTVAAEEAVWEAMGRTRRARTAVGAAEHTVPVAAGIDFEKMRLAPVGAAAGTAAGGGGDTVVVARKGFAAARTAAAAAAAGSFATEAAAVASLHTLRMKVDMFRSVVAVCTVRTVVAAAAVAAAAGAAGRSEGRAVHRNAQWRTGACWHSLSRTGEQVHLAER